jgi:hypothetical protein
MANLPEILGISCGVLSILAHLVYYFGAKNRLNNPNSTSWFVWAILASFNAWNFFALNQSGPLAFINLVGAVAGTTVFVVVLIIGRFDWPDPAEWWTLVVSLLALGVWKAFEKVEYGSGLLAIALIISFIPTWRVLLKGKEEDARPWLMWTVAYGLQVLAVYASSKGIWSYVVPLTCVVVHLLVPVFSWFASGRKLASETV